MLKKKSTPPGKKGTPQKRISGRSNEAIDASLPRDIGNNLNARQTEFVQQYLVDLNATQAAIRAGYSAYHEAGHVIVACELGLPVTSATIVPGEGYSGRVRHECALSVFTF